MSDTFKAIQVNRDENKTQSTAWVNLAEDDLMDGDVTIKVTHSTVNYKDGLALTGRAPVVRRWPLVPGIDFSGEVMSSDHSDFAPGDAVILNGWGVGETHYGGFSERARVSGDWLIKRPDGLSAADAMAIGTAGYTAMLSVLALERHGLAPDDGPIVVTGAAGGVGSIAIALLAKLGFEVHAVTGRTHERNYLVGLGAQEIIDRTELSEPARPLGKERWAGGVDAVGSTMLANVLSMTKYGGAVTACGLAGGMDLPTSVAPFILRGVSLLGIESVMAPKALREEAWARLAKDLDKEKLAEVTTHVPFSDVERIAADILDGHVRGRVVIDIA